jgi:hypothetical protein
MGDNPDFHVDDAAGFPILDRNRDDPTEVVNSPATQSGTFSCQKVNQDETDVSKTCIILILNILMQYFILNNICIFFNLMTLSTKNFLSKR